MIDKTLKLFGLIGFILIVVVLGLAVVVRGFANQVHDLDDAIFESRLERMELQYYDLLIDCHDDFLVTGDAEINDLCNNKLPQVYNEYRELVQEAKTRS